MTWGKRNGKPKVLPKCRFRCTPGEPCRVYLEHGMLIVHYCKVCRRALTALDMMKPKLQIVRPGETPTP